MVFSAYPQEEYLDNFEYGNLRDRLMSSRYIEISWECSMEMTFDAEDHTLIPIVVMLSGQVYNDLSMVNYCVCAMSINRKDTVGNK